MISLKNLTKEDPEIAGWIKKEDQRQKDVLEMIPSENYTSLAVREALGSVLTNKYSEGYSSRRYYQGNRYIDEIETLARLRCQKLFNVPHANVQPYSGSPANSAVYFALLNPGDKIMGLKLSGGGHLTHGHPDVTFSGKYFRSTQFDVEPDGWIDMEKVAKLARKEKPKMLAIGTTAYPRFLDWKKWREIADSVGAFFLADIAHVAGMVAGGVYPSPAPYADVVMFTTHKTIRGPRGAVLMVTQRGLKRDPEMAKKIDKAVFPGLSGGPHDNVTAAIAVCFKEAATPSFKKYAKQIVANAKVLADTLKENGLKLTTDGTDSHLIVIDLRPQMVIGNIVAEALEVANIVANYNTVPHDQNPPMYPSGVRLGTPILTTRKMKEKEMRKIGKWIVDVVKEVGHFRLPEKKEDRAMFIKKTKAELWGNKRLLALGKEIKKFSSKFPVPGEG
ncbi:serine hydroxymethyltransferase [Patescibacteria group bacterium]|nr:serine hydroxymethyltransferase [Patescibacteria group bacterium]MCL5797750.1 serine hydroxymethyltransferase [Patescibacteria group bacterium]